MSFNSQNVLLTALWWFLLSHVDSKKHLDWHDHDLETKCSSSSSSSVHSLAVDHTADAVISAADFSGATCLHHAAGANAASNVDLLLRLGADVNALNDEGDAPLLWAASAGAIDAGERLLSVPNIDVDARNADGFAGVHEASAHKDASVLKALLEIGANATVKDARGRTPLHWATLADSPAAVSLLSTRPEVDLDAADVNGETPLRLAVLARRHELVRRLVAAGADVEGANATSFEREAFDAAWRDEGIRKAVRQGQMENAHNATSEPWIALAAMAVVMIAVMVAFRAAAAARKRRRRPTDDVREQF